MSDTPPFLGLDNSKLERRAQRNAKYWQGRFTVLETSQLEKGLAYYETLDEQYRRAMRSIDADIAKWYARFANNNNISLVDAKKLLNSRELEEFRWSVQEYIAHGQANALTGQWMRQLENASARVHISRLDSLKLQLQHHVETLMGNQLDGMDELYRHILKDGYYHTAYELQRGIGLGWSLRAYNSRQLETVLYRPWTADMRTFRDRCWTQKAELVGVVQTELVQGIIRGDAPDRAITAIQKRFGVERGKAGRVVMTETAYFSSAAQRDCFNDLGVENYEIVATLDLETSELCRSLDGKVFPMSEYRAGVTAPPFHPWCRTCTVPVVDGASIGERAARDADGKVYYVPSDMTYKQWEKTFPKEGGTGDLQQLGGNGTIKDTAGVRGSIIEKQRAYLTDAHTGELDTILEDVDTRQLTLYDKLSDVCKNNDYYKRVGAAYHPGQKKVIMNLDNNTWEKHVGISRSGAFHTKFHEEFHQLDHLLGGTEFAKTSWGTAYKLTATATECGERMIAAIDRDILNTLNKAIDWANEQGNSYKHIKTLDRISADARRSLIQYLHAQYPTQKDVAQIGMFTDAMGLTTGDRLSPHNNGFWGHEAAYNKQRGKDGATSETWATYGAARLQGHPDTEKVMRALMPETFKTYDEIYSAILDYAADNPITYDKGGK